MTSAPAPSVSPTDPATPLWSAVRVGAIVFAVAVICRHAAYWTNELSLHRPLPGFAAILALIEAAAMVRLIVLLLPRSMPDRRRYVGLALVSAVLLLVAAAGLLNDTAALGALPTAQRVLRVVWLTASRLQLLAIPILLLQVAWPKMAKAPSL